MPGARCARSRAWCVGNTRVSHHGHTGNARHSPRNGFNGLLRALPGDRACLPPSPAKVASRKLDASVGASGPHDFAVRFSAVRYRRIRVHRIPPRGRDDRVSPLLRDGTASDIVLIWGSEKPKYFCKQGWTARIKNTVRPALPSRYSPSASSLRKQGPITPGAGCRRRCLPPCRNDKPRRMGPCFRRDDDAGEAGPGFRVRSSGR
jgi:hypothetical protein